MCSKANYTQVYLKICENIWIGGEIREITQDQRGRNH